MVRQSLLALALLQMAPVSTARGTCVAPGDYLEAVESSLLSTKLRRPAAGDEDYSGRTHHHRHAQSNHDDKYDGSHEGHHHRRAQGNYEDRHDGMYEGKHDHNGKYSAVYDIEYDKYPRDDGKYAHDGVHGPAVDHGKVHGKYDGRVHGKYDGKLQGKYRGKLHGKYEGEIDGSVMDKAVYDGRLNGKYDGQLDGKYKIHHEAAGRHGDGRTDKRDSQYDAEQDGRQFGRGDGYHDGKFDRNDYIEHHGQTEHGGKYWNSFDSHNGNNDWPGNKRDDEGPGRGQSQSKHGEDHTYNFEGHGHNTHFDKDRASGSYLQVVASEQRHDGKGDTYDGLK